MPLSCKRNGGLWPAAERREQPHRVSEHRRHWFEGPVSPCSLQVRVISWRLTVVKRPLQPTVPDGTLHVSRWCVSMWTTGVIDSWNDVFSWSLQGLGKVVNLPIMFHHFMNWFFFLAGGVSWKSPEVNQRSHTHVNGGRDGGLVASADNTR